MAPAMSSLPVPVSPLIRTVVLSLMSLTEQSSNVDADATRADRTPRVSIGLPVYNGETFLRAAIDSILNQTFTDLELVISDNASSDATPRICQEYVGRDSRVRYFRNPANIGGSPNHNLVFELSRGELFAWAGHDDIRAPTSIAQLVEELDNHPEASVAYSLVQEIDERDQPLVSRSRDLDFSSPRASDRFRQLIRLDHRIESSYGLIRSSILRRTPLEAQYADSDRVLQAELGLYGPIRRVDEVLLYRREHPGQSTKLYPTRQARTVWYDPNGAGRIVVPHGRQLWEYIRTIGRVPLSRRERLRCYGALIWWARTYRGRISHDLDFALRQLLRPLARSLGVLKLQSAWRRHRTAGATE